MSQCLVNRSLRAGLNCRVLVAAILGLALLALAPVPPAQAQGTSGTLPDPMSTRELSGYFTRLKLSDQQRGAAEMLHDQYKQEFNHLRQGEIAEFLKEMRTMQGSMGAMPKREVIESFLKKMDLISGKIASLDNRYFDQLQTILTEPQLVMVPRVRMARQRARYGGQQIMWMGGQQGPDLSELLMGLELTSDQLAAADSVMGPYETRLTGSMGKLYESSTKMILKMFEAMENLGFNQESMNDPESAQKMGEAMQQVWRDMTKQSAELMASISDLNHRTYKNLVPMLPSTAARALRDRFYGQAYPEAGFAMDDGSAYFEAALKLKELTDEQRQAVTAARDDARRRMDKVLEDAVALIDRNRKDSSPFDYNAERMQEHQEKIAQLQAAAEEIRKTGPDTVNALLGPELSQKITETAVAAARGDGAGKLAVTPATAGAKMQAKIEGETGGEGDEGQADAAEFMNGGDQYLPAAIGPRELADYAARMKLTDEQHAVLSQLHKEYLDKFRAVQEGEVAAVTKAQQAMWMYDEKTETFNGPSPDTVEQIYTLRRAAMQAIRRVDSEFFDDMALAVLKDDQAPLLKRVRMDRERACCNSRGGLMFMFNASEDASIDLSSFVRHQKLADSELQAVDAELMKYEEAATGLLRTRYDVALEMQRAQDKWQAESQAGRGNMGDAVRMGLRYKEIMGDITQRMGRCSGEFRQLNRDTLEKLMSALPSESAYQLRAAYNRRAFPKIYNDPASLDGRLREALKLGDLTDGQRRTVSDLSAEYRPAYAALCEQMVSISNAGDPGNFMMGFDAEQWQKLQERQEAMAKLRFDRNELSTRAANRLRTMLTEDQLHRIGGLPEPSKEDQFIDW